MDRLILVSGDGHAAAPLETYRPYLESKYHGALDELLAEEQEYAERIAGPAHPTPEAMATFDDRGAMAKGGEAGSYDIDIRLAEMDAEGCACELLHSGTQVAPPPWYGVANRQHSPELQWAGVRAYHRWLADFMAAADGRLVGVAEPGPTLDMDASIGELTWLAANGFRSIGVPGIVHDPALPPLYDAYYEPFWAACADLGLVLSVHAGWGQPQGMVYAFFDMVMDKFGTESMGGELDREKVESIGTMMFQEELSSADNSPLRLDLGPRQVMWQLMLGGAFDRHPALKLAMTEIRADWVPATLAALDHLAESTDAPLAMAPSEYYARHCAVSPSSTHRAEVEMRHEIGLRQMIFGIDYPHHEGTWPNTREWIQAAFAGVPEDEARMILGENAIDFYGLDREHLAAIAARIGPEVSDVLGEHAVEDRLVEHFHKRGGFSRPADPVDVGAIDTAFRSDLAGASS
ncbi:MAG TPA: amidohydrolase family protein [Acidimicrobiia bacterium]|nr:amidohydrolase family protein [Acidimicrobiia bacterium]